MRNLFTLLSFLLIVTKFSESFQPLELADENPHFDFKNNSKNTKFETKFRIPKSHRPYHYRLKLIPNLDNFTAPGEVTILFECLESTNLIILHFNSRNEIYPHETQVQSLDENGQTFHVESQNFGDSESYTVELNGILEKSKNYSIYFKFTTSIIDGLDGLYRTFYTDPSSGQVKWLAATQFQSLGARRVFPCFDEPEFKSVFEISLGHDEFHNTLCNMDVRDTEPIEGLEGWIWDHYSPSVVMSTYLIAIAISDYQSEELDPGIYPKPIRIWGAPHHIGNEAGVYSVNITYQTLKHFEEIFGIENPLPKSDSIALPDWGLAPSAMESWGLITYRESALLFFKDKTTELQRKRIVQIIGHELAHNLFGNLVTMKWWDQVWLNEGFATYVAYLGVEFTAPEFKPWNGMITDSVQRVMPIDSEPGIVPLVHENYHGSLIYDKGCALIRMMRAFLTDQTFFTGLHNYLSVNSYASVVQDNLFDELTKQAHLDGSLSLPANLTMSQIMHSWTLTSGFPLIRISKGSEIRIIISQEKFSNFQSGNHIGGDNLWFVPLSIASSDEPDFGPDGQIPKFWLSDSTSVTTYEINTSQWIIINPDFKHYYRVLYDNHFLTLIKQQLNSNSTKFSPGSRSQLIDDYFSFAFNHYERIEKALELTEFLHKETELVVWSPTLKHFTKFANFVQGKNSFDSLKGYLMPKIESALDLFGVEQTEEINGGSNVLLRVQLLNWVCSFGSSYCSDYSTKLFGFWEANPDLNPVPVDIQSTIYCSIVFNNGVEGFEFSFSKYLEDKNKPDPAQREIWTKSLACIKSEQFISLIGLLMDENSEILTQDKNPILQALIGNSEVRDILFDYVQENLNEIISSLNYTAITTITNQLTHHFSDLVDLGKVENFVNSNQDILLPILDELNVHISIIESNIKWMSEFGFDIASWLDKF